MSDDRRQFAREGCLISAHIRAGTKIYEGTLVNISENGGFCATPAPVEPGSTVQIRFRHPWTDEPVTAAAVVMRKSRTGDGLGPQAGVAVALLDSLSDLEDGEANVSLSDSLVPGAISAYQQLRKRAVDAEAVRSGNFATISSGSHSLPDVSGGHPTVTHSGAYAKPPLSQDGFSCTWEGTGFDPTYSQMQKIGAHAFVVLTPSPPDRGRLVRIEIHPRQAGAHPTRIAGKITWSSASDAEAEADGFGVHILHFLSSADERRYQEVLLAVRAAE